MDYRRLYDNCQERFEKVSDVDEAETAVKTLYEKISILDRQLAFEMDSIVGEIARAYEYQGFKNGVKTAKRGTPDNCPAGRRK